MQGTPAHLHKCKAPSLTAAGLFFAALVISLLACSTVDKLFYAATPTPKFILGTPDVVFTATAQEAQRIATEFAREGKSFIELSDSYYNEVSAYATQTAAAQLQMDSDATRQALQNAAPAAESTQEAFLYGLTQTAAAQIIDSGKATGTAQALAAATALPPTLTARAVTQAAVVMQQKEERSRQSWQGWMRFLLWAGAAAFLLLVGWGGVSTFRLVVPPLARKLEVSLVTDSQLVPVHPPAVPPSPASPPAECPAAGKPAPAILIVEPESIRSWLAEAEQTLLEGGQSEQ